MPKLSFPSLKLRCGKVDEPAPNVMQEVAALYAHREQEARSDALAHAEAPDIHQLGLELGLSARTEARYVHQ